MKGAVMAKSSNLASKQLTWEEQISRVVGRNNGLDVGQDSTREEEMIVGPHDILRELVDAEKTLYLSKLSYI